jgi:hypothetical protein
MAHSPRHDEFTAMSGPLRSRSWIASDGLRRAQSSREGFRRRFRSASDRSIGSGSAASVRCLQKSASLSLSRISRRPLAARRHHGPAAAQCRRGVRADDRRARFAANPHGRRRRCLPRKIRVPCDQWWIVRLVAKMRSTGDDQPRALQPQVRIPNGEPSFAWQCDFASPGKIHYPSWNITETSGW